MERAISFAGVFVLVAIAFAFSSDRKKVNWRLVATGIAFQFLFALLVLKTDPGREFFVFLGTLASSLMSFAGEGTKFVFSALADFKGSWGFIFAVQVLPTIIFFASFMNVLYFLGIMEFVVSLIARVFIRLLGTSGAETLCASANIFMGQTEAPLLIRPYIVGLTRSEMMVMMVSGFATLAAGVMFIYAGMMAEFLPSATGHLLAASVMSAPGAIVMAKILVPETEEPQTKGSVKVDLPKTDSNVVEAAASGASAGLNLALNVAAMLIAFIALVAMLNALLLWIGGRIGQPQLDLEHIFGVIFSPMAFLIGVPSNELFLVGSVLGKSLVLNEFVAFGDLKALAQAGKVSGRSIALSCYALCGFTNLSSVGIQIGGIGAMAESRRADLAKLGFKALFAAVLVNLQTAAIAGCLMSERDTELAPSRPALSAPAASSSATPAAPTATPSASVTAP